MAKIRNFDGFGAVFPHFCPDKREVWRGGADLRSAPSCQISRLSGQRVAPAGQKPIFGPLSKNNTGMAALRGGLLVITDLGNIRNPSTTQNFVTIAQGILHMACRYCIASQVMHSDF